MSVSLVGGTGNLETERCELKNSKEIILDGILGRGLQQEVPRGSYLCLPISPESHLDACAEQRRWLVFREQSSLSAHHVRYDREVDVCHTQSKTQPYS